MKSSRRVRSRSRGIRQAVVGATLGFGLLLASCASESLEGVDLSPSSALSTNPDGESNPALLAETTTTSAPQAPTSNSVAETDPPPNPLDLGQIATNGISYVSPSGNDNNDGSVPSRAFRTLGNAISTLTPGDQLFILEGTYEETVRPDTAVVINARGEQDAWIRIGAFPGHDVVVVGTERNAFKFEAAQYVELADLELSGTGTDRLGAGIHVEGPSHHIRILRNEVHGFPAGGINVTGSSHITIAQNEVYGNARFHPTQHSGISFWRTENLGFEDDEFGYSNYVIGNRVYDNENTVPSDRGVITDGNCIILDQTNLTGYTGRLLVANNVCFDNGGRGVNVHESAHADVVNNTVFRNLRTDEVAEDSGELMAYDSSDVRFVNNLAITAPGRRAARNSRSDDVVFAQNLLVTDDPGIGDDTNTVIALDLLSTVVAQATTDPEENDLSLVLGSVAIDAGRGDFSTTIPTDYLGNERLAGEAVDIGAFEFQAPQAASEE